VLQTWEKLTLSPPVLQTWKELTPLLPVLPSWKELPPLLPVALQLLLLLKLARPIWSSTSGIGLAKAPGWGLNVICPVSHSLNSLYKKSIRAFQGGEESANAVDVIDKLRSYRQSVCIRLGGFSQLL